MACPTCRRKRCVWIGLKEDPVKVPTSEIERVISHNLSWIEMEFAYNNGSALAEERAYDALQSYAEELERRKRQRRKS